MARLFCLICPSCKYDQSWVLGYCTQKNIYIYNPFKDCRVGWNTKHTIETKGKCALQWFQDRIEQDKLRIELIEKWISVMDWETGKFK